MDEEMGNTSTLGRSTRMSTRLKRDAVLRILRGEDLARRYPMMWVLRHLLSGFPPENLVDKKRIFSFYIAMAFENVKEKIAAEKIWI